ncbi:zinc ribbon domain-containing protein [Halegenticoccus tardaugens]|uniref:zinc ribbon domain-containing protein n=1 Tax=Halegenticoccus tardaugens TaxID=2071624 RepID=UPI00100BD256|nr:zinc ribbon domain-containing protein [Halegenticoccus tardaugens]
MNVELLFRLALATFVIVAPTALFLGLWHGLHALRDDRLLAQVTAETGHRKADLAPTLGDLFPTARRERTAVDLVACGACGAPNPPDVRFCHDCLSRLD